MVFIDTPNNKITDNKAIHQPQPTIIVLIPCYNEEVTIAKVVTDFKHELPEAQIIVLDNNSTDDSAQIAKQAGAKIVSVLKQGKGAVIRYIFREIDADVYLIADGDGACPASCAHDLISPILKGFDMAMGDRLTEGSYVRENKRRFHEVGNKLVCMLVNRCFNADIKDVMCGYRAFSKKFAKNIPILADGFQVETEMTIRCIDRKLPYVTVPVAFQNRPTGSVSKLHTVRDGFRVLATIFTILKNYRPLLFFGMLSVIFLLLGLIFGIPVLREFFIYHRVTLAASAILATGLVLISAIFLICALILDTFVSYERQRNELSILQFGKREAKERS